MSKLQSQAGRRRYGPRSTETESRAPTALIAIALSSDGAQIPLLDQFLGYLAEEARWLLHGFAAETRRRTDQRMAQVELVARPRNRDIEKAALLLFSLQ